MGSNSAPIAATKSDDITTSCDTTEVTSPTTGKWKEKLAGRSEWSFNVGWLVLLASDVLKLLMVNNTYDITIRHRLTNGTTEMLTGRAICRQVVVRATRGSVAQGSFTFEGTGELAEVSQ